MPTVEEIVTRDKSSGRFHKRFIISSRGFDADQSLKRAQRILTDERCNLDQAGSYDVMPTISRAIDGRGVPVGTDESLLCEYCFPRGADD